MVKKSQQLVNVVFEPWGQQLHAKSAAVVQWDLGHSEKLYFVQWIYLQCSAPKKY